MAEAARRPKLGRKIGVLLGLAFFAYLGYFAYSLATGKERMTAVCGAIKPGMTVDQVASVAAAHGLGPRRLTAETTLAYLADARTTGRHACRVEFADGVVKAATYSFAD